SIAPGVVKDVDVAHKVLPWLAVGRSVVEDFGVGPAKAPLGAPVVVKVPAKAEAAENLVRLTDQVRAVGAVAQQRAHKPVDMERAIEPTAEVERDVFVDEASFSRGVVKSPVPHVVERPQVLLAMNSRALGEGSQLIDRSGVRIDEVRPIGVF